MDFYFCEACGSRVTEVDIDRGNASNKKLKGVFCQKCAIGVSTLDTLPMTDSQAQELLQKSTSKKIVPVARGVRRSTNKSLPSTRRTENIVEEPSQKFYLWGGLAGLLGVAIIFLVMFFSISGKPPARRTVSSEKNVGEPPITAHGKARPTTTGHDHGKGGDIENSLASSQAIDDSKKIDADEKHQPLLKITPPEKKEDAKHLSPEKMPEGAETATPCKSKPDDLLGSKDKESSAEVANPEVATTTPVVESTQVFDERMEQLLVFLADRELAQADAYARKLQEDKAFIEKYPAAAVLPSLMAYLVAQERARIEALTRKIGQDVSWDSSRGKLKGVLLSIEKGQLRVQTTFKINGKTRKGNDATCALAEITQKTWEKIFRSKEPGKAEGWMALSLLHLADGRLELAEGTIQKGAQHPIRVALVRALLKHREKLLDQAAQVAWVSFSEKTTGDVPGERARKYLKELDAFEQKYGESGFARATVNKRSERRAQLQQVAGVFQKRLAALFKGKAGAFDAHTGELSVHYDFAKKDQLEDFESFNVGRMWIAAGGLSFRYGRSKNMGTRRFKIKALDVTFDVLTVVAKGVVLGFGEENGIQVSIENGLCELKSGAKVLASVSGVAFPKKPLRVQLNGAHCVLYLGQKKLLEGTAPEFPKGDLITIGGRKYTLRDLTIQGQLDKEWLDRVLNKSGKTP